MKAEKIRVTREMIINDMGLEDVFRYFADFDTDGDPKHGVPGEVPQTLMRQDGWWIAKTPLRFTVELDGIYHVSDVSVYNHQDKAHTLTLRAGTPFAWENTKKLTPRPGGWTTFRLGYDVRYLNFEIMINDSPAEILLYGYKIEDVNDKVPKRKTHPKTNMNCFVGMNAFVNDADDICRSVNYIREYHNWGWTCYPETRPVPIATNPSTNGQWDFDTYYTKLKKYGISVCPTVAAGGLLPRDRTYDYDDLRSYLPYAEALFQYVARYGKNKDLDPALVHVGEGQEKKIGMGVLDAVEPLNEPDGTWLGREKYFSPFEMAAFLSVCYDGHEGKFKNVGVKVADPSCLMSMSGGAGLFVEHLKAMQFWCKYNRKDGKLPFDIINGHRYATKATYIDTGKTENVDANLDERGDTKTKVYVGISPEEANVEGWFDGVTEWRDRYYPKMQIWLTEFGWDTNQDYRTATSAHAYGEFTGRQVQANWILREYLILSSLGIERAAMYMSRDVGPEETSVGKYGTSGMVTFPLEISANNVIQGNKKDSFYYIYTLKEVLGDTVFDEELPSGNANVRLFRYKTADGKARYAIWCTTSNGTKVPGLRIPMPGIDYEIATPEFESYCGKRQKVQTVDGILTVDVSEKPIFILER